jgi:CelD/BcsL family acetyltransferase involved in cellulose biosynthesis/peptidoglycan/xylan/chitin deacetylase (PgdA/CDA1 family)
MRILLHETWDDVGNLSEKWNGLLTNSASNTIFLTWEWLDAWWNNYGSQRPLFVLSAWEGDALEGIAPFYLDNLPRWGRNWKCLKLIGDGSRDSDYLDCIARNGRENEIVGEFVRFLESQRNRWDCLEFHGTPENSPCLKALMAHVRPKAWRFSSEAIPCATLPLPGDWNQYLKLLKPRFRTQVRSTMNYYDEKIGALPVQCEASTDIEGWLPILFDLHTRRWQSKDMPGVFGANAKQNFYRDVSKATLSKGWLAFHRLDWGERPLAMQYGFRYDNRFFLLQEGYDPEFATLRPGMALRGSLIRHWIDSGLAEYDFLAGSSAYKFEWGGQLKQSVRLTLSPAWPAAWVSFGEAQAIEKSKEAIRAIVPESILAWRKERKDAHTSQKPPALSVTTNGHRSSLGRRVMTSLYASTALGSIGRAIASRYELDLAHTRLNRRKTPICQIFIFHRVNDDYDPFLPSVPVAVFRKQMEFLRQNFPIISLDEVASGSYADSGEKYSVAITFDDGYRDNFLKAFPVLNKLEMPATIFLATGSIQSSELPWYDQISWAFKLTTRPRFSLADVGGPEANLNQRSAVLQAMGNTLAWLRTIDDEKRRTFIPRIFEELGVSARLSVPNPMLSWDEIKQMSKQKITFGAHTISHPALSRTNSTRLETEIVGSKNQIEEALDLPVRHFAYPFGQPSDVSDEAKKIVQRAGFSSAVTTVWGFNRPGDDLYDLKRFSPRSNAWDSDLAKMAMKLDWYRLAGLHAGQKIHVEAS